MSRFIVPPPPLDPLAPVAPFGPVKPAPRSRIYLTTLAWAFAAFNGIRIVTYLPTLWAIHTSGSSDQHSLLTWLAWTLSNATMALWLYESHDRRANRAMVVTAGNAAMCFATTLVIVHYRI